MTGPTEPIRNSAIPSPRDSIKPVDPWRWNQPPLIDQPTVARIDALCEQELFHNDLKRKPESPDELILIKVLGSIFHESIPDQPSPVPPTVAEIATAMKLLQSVKLSAADLNSKGEICLAFVSDASLNALYELIAVQSEEVKKQLNVELGFPNKNDAPIDSTG